MAVLAIQAADNRLATLRPLMGTAYEALAFIGRSDFKVIGG